MNDPDKNNSYSIKFVLWAVFYCYSTFAALIFQKIALPLFPGFHGGRGLIEGDSVFFHGAAIKLAEAIRTYGWSQWTPRPAAGATGNVSFLAVLYALFGNDPSLMIPFNAVMHATSGLLVFLIARLLWPGRVGVYSGVITASLFIVFPSALNWYGQMHKDTFAILGMLIIFYSWLKATRHSWSVRYILWSVLGSLTGVMFVIFVRPYNIMLLIMSGTVLSLTLWMHLVFQKKIAKALSLTGLFCIFVIVFGIINWYMPKMAPIESKGGLGNLLENQGTHWEWKSNKTIPSVDRLIENITVIRMTNVYHIKLVSAQSGIDEIRKPDNAWSVIAYLPRAAFIGLFAPFPSTWFERSSVTSLVSVGETAIWYLLIPGVFLAFWYRRSLPLFLMVINSIIFLTVLGFTQPNLGTLYRFRYVYLFILMLIGVMGWMELLRRRYGDRIRHVRCRPNKEEAQSVHNESPPESLSLQTRSTIATAGFAVVIFTLLSNVLLVVRDIILARWFGLGNELDAFFIAMIVPMFLVAVLSIPIGTAMIPPLIDAFKIGSREKVQELITSSSTMIFCSMLLLCLLVLVFARYYLPVIGWGFSAEKIAKAWNMLIIVVPLLFFSGFVILGNSIVNARQRFALPALAQAIVPIIAIVVLLLVARQIGIYAIAIGMGIGQLANLFIIGFYVRREGYTIFPAIRPSAIRDVYKRSSEQLNRLLFQYAPLVFAAVFVSLAVPVNNMIAASLAPGSVSAFNLGSKFIIFFTGLIGTGISTVILPYFSSYFADNNVVSVRRELSFFLFLAVVIPIPLTVIMYLLTSSLISLIFRGGVFTVHDLGTVTRIMEYGIIQIPFFCTNMLFVKFANARRKNKLIMISSLSGLIMNVVLSLIFIGRMGVAGIALASSLSVMFATIIFVVVGHTYNDVSSADVVFIGLTWLLFLTILLCYHFNNMFGFIVTSVLLVVTVTYHLVRFFGRQEVNNRTESWYNKFGQ